MVSWHQENSIVSWHQENFANYSNFELQNECISSERSKLHRGIKSISNNNACDEGIQTVSSVPCDSSMQLWLSHRPTKQVLTVHKYFNKSLEVEAELYFYIAANLSLKKGIADLWTTYPHSKEVHFACPLKRKVGVYKLKGRHPF